MEEISTFFSPKGGCAAAVAAFINGSTTSLDVAIYSLTNDTITNAIIAAHARGVKVRALMDNDQVLHDRYSDHGRLLAVGIEVKFDTQHGLMHNKYAVVDGAAVATGSFNWTVSADTANAENLLILRIPAIAAAYAANYEHLWAVNVQSIKPIVN